MGISIRIWKFRANVSGEFVELLWGDRQIFHAKRSDPLFSERSGTIQYKKLAFGWRIKIIKDGSK